MLKEKGDFLVAVMQRCLSWSDSPSIRDNFREANWIKRRRDYNLQNI